jgi:hypothetical protein
MRSLNEIDTTLQKAAIGAGLPVGLAEDVGHAGAWLAARGHDGVRAVLMAVRDGMSTPVIPVKENGRLVFSSARIAVCGPSAIDILVGDDSVDEALLLNVDSPLLIIGLVGGAAQSYDLEMTIGFRNGSNVSLVAGDMVMTGPVPAAGTEAVITICKTVDKTPTKKITTRRVLVDEEIWHEAHALAARTYVPSTEASHAQGAGAGMLDND